MRHTHGLPFPHETDSRRSAPGDATAPRSSRRGATDISLSFCTDFFVLRPPPTIQADGTGSRRRGATLQPPGATEGARPSGISALSSLIF